MSNLNNSSETPNSSSNPNSTQSQSTNYSEALINPNEMSMFFDDILKNKEMIKQMLSTNILIYNDKVFSNGQKIKEIREELAKIDLDFLMVENKLKLDFAKCHENMQKHEINFKLLDKTHSHYRSLILEREGEIRKLEEKLLFAEQDFQNKKIKLDCLNIQITEAEFQLKNLNSRLNEQVENIIEEGDSDSIIEFKRRVDDTKIAEEYGVCDEGNENYRNGYNYNNNNNRAEDYLNVEDYMNGNKSYYERSVSEMQNKNKIVNGSEIFDSISNKNLSLSKMDRKKNKSCLIF